MRHAFRGSRRLFVLAIVGSAAVAVVALTAVGSAAAARRTHAVHKTSPTITSQSWGTAHGQNVNLYTLNSGHKMIVKITNYGGVVQSIWVPGRRGGVANVALGFKKLSDYVNLFENQPWPAPGGSGNAYFGAIIGRYANRIAGAEFTLNGTKYPLGSGPPCPASPTPNSEPNLLHGGPNAYNTQVWDPSTSTKANAVTLTLTYTDPNCKNGFPGTVHNTVSYTLNNKNALIITYHSTTDAPTVINLTNHTYFNLAGEGSGTIYDQLLQIRAKTFTPVDQNLIPTGVFAPVAGTPFDFRTMKPIGRDIRNGSAPQGDQLVIAHGYDHNWVLNGGVTSKPRLVAVAEDPASGRVLRTYTTEPGVQVYTGNFLLGDLVGTSGRTYRQGDAFTLETQHYPDTPHHIGDPNWPSVVLNPGQAFNSQTIFKFGTTGKGQQRRK